MKANFKAQETWLYAHTRASTLTHYHCCCCLIQLRQFQWFTGARKITKIYSASHRGNSALSVLFQETVVRTWGLVFFCQINILASPQLLYQLQMNSRVLWVNHHGTAALWHTVHDETQQGVRLEKEGSWTQVLQQIWGSTNTTPCH